MLHVRIILIHNPHNTRNKNRKNMNTPSRNNKHKFTISKFLAPKFYNLLPEDVRQITRIKSFRCL